MQLLQILKAHGHLTKYNNVNNVFSFYTSSIAHAKTLLHKSSLWYHSLWSTLAVNSYLSTMILSLSASSVTVKSTLVLIWYTSRGPFTTSGRVRYSWASLLWARRRNVSATTKATSILNCSESEMESSWSRTCGVEAILSWHSGSSAKLEKT